LTRSYAGRFLKDFPNSPRLAEIREIGVEPADGETVLPGLKPPAPAPAAQPVPDTAEFAAALDLYQGRKYQEARAAFAKIRGRDKPAEISLAGFYETECLRKLGDLDGLANALKSVVKSPTLGRQRLRQLEIDTLWEAVRFKNWEQADQQAKQWSGELLPGGQRAQVACCLALALENLGRPNEALNAFNIAMTADAGASEDVARRAALGVLRILNADPDVQAAIAKWGSPDEDRGSPGFFRLKEAASVAALFELSLGAGAPFPGEFRHFLKYAEPSAHN
jgi:tetratricopeptide (TPR) repeat protein